MNNDNSTKALLKRYLQRVYELAERLEGMSPATSSPAPCSETSGARTEHDAHNKITTPLRHSETEEGVKLKQVYEMLIDGAAEVRAEKDGPESKSLVEAGEAWESIAANLEIAASKLLEISREPSTKSGAGEDERCPDCNGQGQHTYMSPEGPDLDVCHFCEGSGSRRERSESRNDQTNQPEV